MADLLEHKKRKRFQLLKALYDATDGGHPMKHAKMNALGAPLGFDAAETEQIALFLEGEGLLKFATMGENVELTHYGVQEVERALSAPEQPTEYFPPVINIVNVGAMHGSQLVQAGAGSTVAASVGAIDGPSVARLVAELRAAVDPAQWAEKEDAEEAEASLATIEAQARRKSPSREILRESLKTLRSVAEGTASGVAAAEILK